MEYAYHQGKIVFISRNEGEDYTDCKIRAWYIVKEIAKHPVSNSQVFEEVVNRSNIYVNEEFNGCVYPTHCCDK